ncbi:vesicle-associated membrane protein 7-like [Haliotis rubra]|uniref:vesicle-associated membrane protein 7-like n=1 Tax=Haliotis rubra TaxID=36100 RepID=UPI001EE57834|nr:vesicle-associated membrane protein 7-like [Haliotis rubra]XP_046583912.1 vesicle-associated membrane protein 7-like [Haliotis rubra]
MPLLYAVIARGTTVLAKYASCAGNFSEVTEQILGKITPETSKLTYSHGSYLFHYVIEDRLVYLCITDDDFERSRAFLFLNEIKKRFHSQYGVRAQTALPFAMNSEFSRVIASQMRFFSEDRPDHLTKVQDQVDELKGIMVRNIDAIADRGERLELLVDKTDDLSTNAVSFKKSSRNLARSLWWKNVKITVIIAVVVIVILYFIVSASCGGLSWPNCTKK